MLRRLFCSKVVSKTRKFTTCNLFTMALVFVKVENTYGHPTEIPSTYIINNILFTDIFIVFNTPSFNNGEYEVKLECDDCFIALRDVASLLSTADYSPE